MSAEPARIRVEGPAPYDVVIGTGLPCELPLAGADRVAVVYSQPVAAQAERVRSALGPRGHLIEVPDGEAAKTVEVAALCWERLGQLGFTRNDAVVGVGGGSVTDLAGWVAAGWLRGVRVVHVPTTLLGMLDAAVGGKTGVNTRAGKNLVGAFHPPAGVLCDLATLATLPAADYAAGLAEAVKCGFVADPAILDLIERDPAAAGRPDAPVAAEIVRRCVQVKADIVGRDLRETGPREFLNYGHTLAHAIERAENYRWRHGDAVSVGLVFAAELGRLADRLGPVVASRHRTVLAGLGLPTSYDGAFAPLLQAMRVDKKARGRRLRFVVLDDLARPSILDNPDEEVLAAAYLAVGTG